MTDRPHSASVGLVTAYLTALENRDEAACRSLFADDIIETVPLNVSGDPEPQAFFDGKEEVLEYFRLIMTNFQQTRLVDKMFYESSDGATVFCEAKGDLIAAKDSKPYKNVYVFKFDVKDGRIVGIKEYANPVTYAKAMGQPIG